MTTDPFTEADLADYARAEAETRWPQRRADHYAQQLAFVAGAEWARDHLAAQEPTDAEVRYAALAVSAVDDNGCFFCTPDDTPYELCTKYARAALSAARAARRVEKDAP